MKLFYPDYTNSIMNVSNSILKSYGVQTKYPTQIDLDKELNKNYNHIIYILLDGMGSNIVDYHLDKEDALKKYKKTDITSVFPPTTVAATDAVLSGTPPIVNGHLGWVQYFPKEDTNLIVFQNKDFYNGKTPQDDLREKYLSFDKMYKKISDVNPNINTNEFFPSFRPGGSDSFLDEIEKVLLVTHNTDTSFNYLYWIEPDISEHINGIYSTEVKEILKNLNSDFEELIANINDDTLVICIADHGLTDVEELPLYNYSDVTDLLIRKPSIEPRATNFFVTKNKIDEFKINFNRHFSKYFKLYTKQEILDSNIFGEGEKHPMIDSFLGDYIAIAIDKYMFTLSDSKGYKAHHAGLSKDEMIVPLIIYSKEKA